ncbi:MAG TPA: motility protein A [Candidatus Marinimicrobia bacterium]|nr:motility protein A [Candidatus Neomarinimicrobiota bacterium]
MDPTTLIGIIAGLILIIISIGGENLAIFINFPSMVVVMGGSLAAILVNYSMNEILSVMGVVKKAFFNESFNEKEIIDTFVELSKKSRREGILAVDKELSKISDPFMRMGLEMTVDGVEPETIRNVMETELSYLMDRHKKGQGIFINLGAFAPAFGMIGTLMGLIIMLKNLEDPSGIGLGMSVALITTFYGSVLANLLFIPISGKLKNRSDQEILVKEMVIEGVLAIQYGEHPSSIERMLLNFIPPKLRAKESDNKAAG